MKYFLLLLLISCTIPEETGSINIFFCDQTNCTKLLHKMNNSNCAFYNAKNFPINASLIIDGNNRGLMHNKFCVKDDYVWTGSWNPSQKMKIPNNAILIESKTIAKAYQLEFSELSKGIFHGGKSRPGKVKLNDHLIETYFCPEDNCQTRVLDVLENAEKSVHFMTFSFTDNKIGDLLLKKSKNMEVKGIFDPRKNKYSEYKKLKHLAKLKKVHHKVFIIDQSIVIAGSYNPSKNANENNDENLVIIYDSAIAEKFEQEFSRLFT